jgi:hypothetical protein
MENGRTLTKTDEQQSSSNDCPAFGREELHASPKVSREVITKLLSREHP